jgi:hypothetical protein
LLFAGAVEQLAAGNQFLGFGVLVFFCWKTFLQKAMLRLYLARYSFLKEPVLQRVFIVNLFFWHFMGSRATLA